MPRNSAAYDEDFFAWTQDQARLLRAGDPSLLDTENLAEEIESMGRNNRRELRSRLIVLLVHLLKWHFQKGRRSRSWIATVNTQRNDIEGILADSPSLVPAMHEMLAEAYARARRDAAGEANLPIEGFPKECPFALTEILSADFSLR